MSPGRGRAHVAVVGAGAAGTLAAARLLAAATARGRAVTVRLVDPAPDTGRGVAYRTEDPRHLLNVPAGRMSGDPGDPDHFVRWLAARGRPRASGDYVPRGEYGRYLEDVLHTAAAASRDARLDRVHDRVTAVRRQGDAVRLDLAGGG
ncbi:FAD/NAD(P)-binding protein, partial [Streptomyces flaveolus]|uniref:FAD/NAD(P)-binding protein n=1 Tax=Streptomyces flaveolus TaxID=67297 RepID=UPI00342EBD0D